MGVTQTPRLGLEKPDYDATADIETVNSNMDTLDAAVGVSIVNTVAQITDPYNGQFAYELNNRQLRFFIQGEWLLVAAGDLNSGNPDRIRLPNGTLNNMGDTTNAFQIGADSSVNVAMDQNEIQARDNGGPGTLYLNEKGGDVHIGPSSEVVINNKGLKSDNMDSGEAFDGTQIDVNATTWVSGTPNVQVILPAPPSGKFLVLLCGRSFVNSGGADATIAISYEVTRNSNGNVVAGPGTSGNTLRNTINSGNSTGQGNITNTVADVIKGLTVGEQYKFQVQHQKSASGVAGKIDFRKIIVIPQV